MTVDFRIATATDAPALAALAARTFREAFGKDNTADDTNAHCAKSYGPAQQRSEIIDPMQTVILAEDAGELVAYAHLRRVTPPAVVTGPDPVQLLRFYVLSVHHGRGLARDLMNETIARARAGGAKTLYLGVWERNDRAIAFYKKHGFAQVGTEHFVVGTDCQNDFLFVRAI